MNAIDLFILVILLVGFVKGLFDGFIKQAISLIAIVVASYGCSLISLPIEIWIRSIFSLSKVFAHTMSLTISFLAILIIISCIGSIISKIIGKTPIGILNHLAGGIAGICITAILMSYLFMITDNIIPRKDEDESSIRKNSTYYDQIRDIVPTFIPTQLFTK